MSPEFTAYNVGPRLEGLEVIEAVRVCAPADPEFPELGRHDDVTYLYGECPIPQGAAAKVEGGCLPPIEIQSTPIGQKHRGLYQQPEMRAEYEEATIKGVPAAIFDDGRIVEIYTRDTTITVYGQDPAQALRFADALRLALDEDVPAVGRPLHRLSEAGSRAPILAVLPPPPAGILDETEPRA